MLVNVEQSGEEFVQRVPRNPTAVEVEGLDANISGGDFLKYLLPVGNGGDVAIAVRALTRFQLGDDVIYSFTKASVAR